MKNSDKWTALSNFTWVKTWTSTLKFCLAWTESLGTASLPVYLLFGSLVLEPNFQVCPLYWTPLSSFVPYEIPGHWLIFWSCFGNHFHSRKPFPITSFPTYHSEPFLLSATRPGAKPVEGHFSLSSPLTRLTLLETKTKSWRKLTWLNELKVIPEQNIFFW